MLFASMRLIGVLRSDVGHYVAALVLLDEYSTNTFKACIRQAKARRTLLKDTFVVSPGFSTMLNRRNLVLTRIHRFPSRHL